MITATCATLAALLASASPPTAIFVQPGDCPALVIKQTFAPPVTIYGPGVQWNGITISGGGVAISGGKVRSPGGQDGFAAAGYGARLTGQDITLSGMTFGASKKAIVTNGGGNIRILNNRFEGVGEDGVIASRTIGLEIVGNWFGGFTPYKTTCTAADGTVTRGLAKRNCVGTWRDGYHSDAIQFRNGVTDVVISGNTVAGVNQGIGQMDSPTDRPPVRVAIIGNDVAVADFHSITVGASCIDCSIVGNRISNTTTNRTVYRFGPSTTACGNTAAYLGTAGLEACKP